MMHKAIYSMPENTFRRSASPSWPSQSSLSGRLQLLAHKIYFTITKGSMLLSTSSLSLYRVPSCEPKSLATAGRETPIVLSVSLNRVRRVVNVVQDGQRDRRVGWDKGRLARPLDVSTYF